MDVRAIFGLSAAMSLVSSLVAARLFLWPWLRERSREQALAGLIAPHMFLRFIGMSFLVVGVVSPSLPAGFAVPAAWGDFVAGVLAIVATLALSSGARWALGAAWVFNVWGAADLLLAFYLGPHLQIRPETLGAAFFLPTAIVPPLLVSHFLTFGVLARRKAASAAHSAFDKTLGVAS